MALYSARAAAVSIVLSSILLAAAAGEETRQEDGPLSLLQVKSLITKSQKPNEQLSELNRGPDAIVDLVEETTEMDEMGEGMLETMVKNEENKVEQAEENGLENGEQDVEKEGQALTPQADKDLANNAAKGTVDEAANLSAAEARDGAALEATEQQQADEIKRLKAADTAAPGSEAETANKAQREQLREANKATDDAQNNANQQQDIAEANADVKNKITIAEGEHDNAEHSNAFVGDSGSSKKDEIVVSTKGAAGDKAGTDDAPKFKYLGSIKQGHAELKSMDDVPGL